MNHIDDIINSENRPVMEERINPITESKSFQQLGILVLDGSGTMKDLGETGQTKANEVRSAVRSLIGKLKISTNRNNFYLSIVTYDEDVKIFKEPTQVLDMSENDDYNPLNGHGGLTAIGDALEKASEIAERFYNENTEYPRSVVIILMTDGKNNEGKDPKQVVEMLKESGKIGMGKIESIRVAGYGKDKQIDDFTLQQLDTHGNYQRCYTADSLRVFLAESMGVGTDGTTENKK